MRSRWRCLLVQTFPCGRGRGSVQRFSCRIPAQRCVLKRIPHVSTGVACSEGRVVHAMKLVLNELNLMVRSSGSFDPDAPGHSSAGQGERLPHHRPSDDACPLAIIADADGVGPIRQSGRIKAEPHRGSAGAQDAAAQCIHHLNTVAGQYTLQHYSATGPVSYTHLTLPTNREV